MFLSGNKIIKSYAFFVNSFKTRNLAYYNAARNHARQIRNSVFNLPNDFNTDIEERVKIYVNWLVKQKTEENLNVNDTMRYLLFNDKQTIEERVYESL